jgi:hypothetical protein
MTRKKKKSVTGTRYLSVFDQHRLKIARKTLAMNPKMVAVLGGMTIEEAEQVIKELTGKEDDHVESD